MEDIVTGEKIGGEAFPPQIRMLKTHTEEVMLQITGTVRIADMQVEDTRRRAVATHRTEIVVAGTVLTGDTHLIQIGTPHLEEDNL